MRLLSSQGEIVRGRCRSVNLCSYCARLGAVENAELLALDALAGQAPAVWAVLTTRTASIDTRRFYKSREVVVRALRRRWPALEYAALVEFTTGYGTSSGGLRRPHWNLLLKGVPADDVDQVAEVIRRVWCEREDARPEAQHVGTVGEFGGLMRYIALHFQKESQAPPEGWSGWRFLKSRRYLATSTPEARIAARASLRHKREVWRALRSGLTGETAEAAAQHAIALAEATTWRVVDVTAALTGSTRPERGAAARSAGRAASAVSVPAPAAPANGVGALAAAGHHGGGRASPATAPLPSVLLSDPRCTFACAGGIATHPPDAPT